MSATAAEQATVLHAHRADMAYLGWLGMNRLYTGLGINLVHAWLGMMPSTMQTE